MGRAASLHPDRASAELRRRVAVLGDVHGNVVALEAALCAAQIAAPDLVVFTGDLTWGPLPEETTALLEPFQDCAIFIRGNAERALLEGPSPATADDAPTVRERWMHERHAGSTRAFLAGFVPAAVVEVEGLGAVRFCHGSPRSDEELITYATPEPRMRALLEGVPERVLVSAHTHIQFDRMAAGVRSVNPGSVGLPYGGRPGAYWALLGPDVDLQRTDYDLDEAARRYRASGDLMAEELIAMLVAPPTAQEVVEHAEALEFSG